MTHTPGPWTQHSHAPFSVWAGDIQVAACKSLDDGSYLSTNKSGVAEANARLIAAAPDLLDALNNFLECHNEGRIPTAAALNRAEAAIDKATNGDTK